MSQPMYGQIPEFYAEYDNWDVYYERLEQFFAINDIPEDKQSAFLISVIGSNTYKILRDLCDPTLPKEKSFDELCELLRRQFAPKISIFRERTKYYIAHQEEHENITTWYRRMKTLSVNCKFEENLEAVLLDKFITGLKNGPVLDRLCEENETVSLLRALEIAVNKESALTEVKDSDVPIHPYLAICPVGPYFSQETDEMDVEEDVEDVPEISRCPPIKRVCGKILEKQGESEIVIEELQKENVPPVAMRCFEPPMTKAYCDVPPQSDAVYAPSSAPLNDMPMQKCAAPKMPMALCDAPPQPICDAPPMSAAPPIKMAMQSAPLRSMLISNDMANQVADIPNRIRMMKSAPVAFDHETIENFETEEKDIPEADTTKKKTKRGCRGGRKHKKA